MQKCLRTKHVQCTDEMLIKVSSNRPDRKSPLLIRNLFKKLKRGELQLCEQLDVSFIGEEGIDATGLRKGNKGYMLFEGEANHMLPIHCEGYVQSKLFVYAGQLIGFSSSMVTFVFLECPEPLQSTLLLEILKMQYLIFVLRTFLILILDYLSRR